MAKKDLRSLIQFYLIESKSITGKIIEAFIILLNLAILGILVADTYNISAETKALLWIWELIIVGIFIIEYAARIYGSKDRSKQLYNIYSIIDLVTILPTVILFLFPVAGSSIAIVKILRVFRVFRIFRLLRFTSDPNFFFGKITDSILVVVRLFMTLLIIFFVSANLFHSVENEVNPQVNDFGDSFYYTVVTIATVGFGDIIPHTSSGRWITVLTIISGIIFLPWQASRVFRQWLRVNRKYAVCKRCGLKYHDRDASHCKACGNIIYQEFDGH